MRLRKNTKVSSGAIPPAGGAEPRTSVQLGEVTRRSRSAAVGRGVVRVLSRRFLLPGIAGVLAIALAVVGYLNYQHSQDEEARRDAMKAVVEHVEKLLSYTPATVTSDLDAELAWLTGDFRDEYSLLITKTIAPTAEQNGVTATATVTGKGIESSSQDKAEILLFLKVDTSTTAVPDVQSLGSRVKVTAVKKDGEWLIDGFTPL